MFSKYVGKYFIINFLKIRLLPRNKPIFESRKQSYFSGMVLFFGKGLFFGNKKNVYVGIVLVDVTLGNRLISRRQSYLSVKAYFSEIVLFIVLFPRNKPSPKNMIFFEKVIITTILYLSRYCFCLSHMIFDHIVTYQIYKIDMFPHPHGPITPLVEVVAETST